MAIVWILLTICFLVNNISTQTVQDYKNIIDKGIQNSLNYKLPTDASRYQANIDVIQEYGEDFDFIIIGGGVTGSVITSRLSERKNFKVLLLEAGNFTDNGIIQFPRLFIYSVLSNYNWGYTSIPQTTACLGTNNRVCSCPRGRGVGGTSLINGLVYSRGHPDNYDNWARILKDSSWSYKNVLKYFKKSENFHWTDKKAPVNLKYHGTKGLLNVQHKLPHNFLDDIFFKANNKLGIKPVDYNSNKELGVSIFQCFTKNGTRQDLGTAFVIPFVKRPNLKVLTESYVIKIEINNKTRVAQSVLFTKGGLTYRVRAKKEIILSAGAISSPQILLYSGVGPKKHLQQVGIPLVADLEVGSKLQDHTLLGELLFSTNLTLPKENLEQQIKDYIKGIGTLTASNKEQGVGFYKTKNRVNKGEPNLELFYDTAEFSPLKQSLTLLSDNVTKALWSNYSSGFIFYLVHMDTRSTGTIRLKNKNPFEYPLINPNLLSDPKNKDIDELYEGLQLLFKLTDTTDFKSLKLQYMSDPLPACKHLEFKSKQYWYCFLRQISQTCYHPSGTCPMGRTKENGAVVDSKLKVFNIKRLRVADASVFPAQITGHPSVPCIMIGEKISDDLKYLYH